MFKKKKPPNLTVEVPVEVQAKATDSPDKMESLWKAMSELDLSEEQKQQMKVFLKQKSEVIKHGKLEEYHLVRLAELGYSNCSVILKVVHKLSGIVMVRKMVLLDIKQQMHGRILREMEVLHKCNSPYIIGFFGSFFVKQELSICIQLMDGGSLDLILNLGRIPVNMIGRITTAVLRGMKYLHDVHMIIHRDVKPSNILVNSLGEIKLCDPGVSGQLINSMANSFTGDRSYMAPERLEGQMYSVLSDIWSLGFSLIEIAIGRYPIPTPAMEEVAEEMKQPPAGTIPARPCRNPYCSSRNAIRIPLFELLAIMLTGDPPTLPADYFSQDIREFVELCLQKDPKKRGNLTTLLSHKFIQDASNMSTSDFAAWVQRTIEAKMVDHQESL